MKHAGARGSGADHSKTSRLTEAVAEGVSAEAAGRIAGLNKGEMAEAAEQLLAGTRWLPAVMRKERPCPAVAEVVSPALAAE